MLEYRDAVAAVRAVATARGATDSGEIQQLARALLRPATPWPAETVGMTAYLDMEFDFLAPPADAKVPGTPPRQHHTMAPAPRAASRPLQQALRDLADALDAAALRVGDARAADRLVAALHQNDADAQAGECDGTLAGVLLGVLGDADVQVLPLLAEFGLLDG